MPRGDGTGPAGLGPMTGRGAGYCADFVTPGFANSIPRGGRFGYAPYYGNAPAYPVGGRVPYAPSYGYAGYGAFPRLGLGWGRGRGICGPGMGRRAGMGRGGGRGRGRCFW